MTPPLNYCCPVWARREGGAASLYSSHTGAEICFGQPRPQFVQEAICGLCGIFLLPRTARQRALSAVSTYSSKFCQDHFDVMASWKGIYRNVDEFGGEEQRSQPGKWHNTIEVKTWTGNGPADDSEKMAMRLVEPSQFRVW